MEGNGLIFSTPPSFAIDLREDKPEVVYSFTPTKPFVDHIVAVWYGGESHIGHWFHARTGSEIAMVTRYKDGDNDLYTADEWLAFFVEDANDFYDNWEADDWYKGM